MKLLFASPLMADQLAKLSLAFAVASFGRAFLILIRNLLVDYLDQFGTEIGRRWEARRRSKRKRQIKEAEGHPKFSWAAIRATWMQIEEKGRRYPVALSLVIGFFFLGLALLLAH